MRNNKIILLVLALVLMFSLLAGCTNNTNEENEKSANVEENENAQNNNSEENTEENTKTIATEELLSQIENTKYVIVDTRSSSEYIGWKLNGEKRGGHIKNAVDFPITWTNDSEGKQRSEDELMELLNSKGIDKDKTVVLYDAKKDKSLEMEKILENLGYENVMIYEAGIVEWAKDENLPMSSLPKYEKLVYAGWINELINDENPSTYTNNKYKIIEVSWGEGDDYKKGHIPFAVHLDTNEIEELPLWNSVSDKDIEQWLLKYGIEVDTTVVLYGADTTTSARAASIMMYAGVEDVRVLDGGFSAWVAGGFDVEAIEQEPVAVESFGATVPVYPEYIINTDEAKKILADDNAELVSIRSWAEYIGETSGYSYIEPKGRISGAVWGHAGSDAYHMEDFRNIDNTMRNYHEIEKLWEEWSITPDKNISFFCGTGWRASETFFYAYLMGWEKISVYDGGWFEWSKDETNPIETGEPIR